MNKRILLFLMLFGIGTVSCNSQVRQPKKALVQGTITVSDSLDPGRDYSGIGLTIIKQDSTNAPIDTLLHLVTDREGAFSGTVEFKNRGFHPILLTRNNANLGIIQAILADNDTLTIKGVLPDIAQNIELDSREHRALKLYQRLERNFNRVAIYINAGKLSEDSTRMELSKWSDIFWQAYEANSATLAGELAASDAVRLLSGWNEDEMMKLVNQSLKKENLIPIALQYGLPYRSKTQGLESGIAYLDSLNNLANDPELKRIIMRRKVTDYYDSLRVDAALASLHSFEKTFGKDPVEKDWITNLKYDLSYLAPGLPVPDFEFVTEAGDSVSSQSLMGTPYILELTTLNNSLYQESYERSKAIFLVYKNIGLQMFTIPLDRSQITIDAFFEERGKMWPIVKRNGFNERELLEKLNIKRVPTWILVDKDGLIVKKYVGIEYQNIVDGLAFLNK